MAQHNLIKKQKCLVLGNTSAAALAVVRSLGRGGIDVTLGYDKADAICRRSRYARKKVLLADSRAKPLQWLAEVINCLKSEKYDLVIPVSDSALLPLFFERNKISQLADFAIPDERGFEYTYRKNLTYELAEKLGVPCPQTYTADNLDALLSVYKNLNFPIVIKPSSSKVFKGGVMHNLTPKVANNLNELLSRGEALLRFNPVCLQNFVKGESVGQFFLMKDGEPWALFQHQRIHQPDDGSGLGGGSSYRKSVELNPVLLDYSLKMLKDLKWTGVAMAEYIYDPQNEKAYLMEINGRFWGSLPLAVASGVDFPLLLFKMHAGQEMEKCPSYRKNIFCRNIELDFDWSIEKFRRSGKKIHFLFSRFKKVPKAAWGVIKGREHFDEFTKDDPWPGIAAVSFIIRSFILSAIRQPLFYIRSKIVKFFYKNFRFSRFYKMNLLKNILLENKKNLEITFVCRGNVCRSPTAEHLLGQILKNEGIDFVRVGSAGIFADKSYCIDDSAVKAAKDNKIEIKTHGARKFAEEIGGESSIIFVFDFSQYFYLMRRFPALLNKVFFLGLFKRGEADIEINDPYGAAPDIYGQVYREISDSLNNFTFFLKRWTRP